jgi:AcrR family transcriptional regulator
MAKVLRVQAVPSAPAALVEEAPQPADDAEYPEFAEYTVSALAARTGVSVQSIHHYRRLGLLPEPRAVASNRHLYDERHVEALRVVRFLREEGRLPLATIRDVLPSLLDRAPEEGADIQRWRRTVSDYRSRTDPTAASARLVAAARRCFAGRGYDAVNVEDICDEAGVAKGSFYRHFASKYDIFLAAARSTVDVVGDELDDRGDDSLSEQEAVDELRPILEPLLPLYLEVLTRELRGDQKMTGVFAGITEGLVSRLSPRLRTRGQSALAAAGRVVESALLGLVRPIAGAR